MQDFIKINKDDNVAVALKPIAKGTTVNVAGTEVTTVEDIPQGHKFVIKEIKNSLIVCDVIFFTVSVTL